MLRSLSGKVSLTKPEDVYSNSSEEILIGMIMIDINNAGFSTRFEQDANLMIDSLLGWSSGDPLHFVIITDKYSADGRSF